MHRTAYAEVSSQQIKRTIFENVGSGSSLNPAEISATTRVHASGVTDRREMAFTPGTTTEK